MRVASSLVLALSTTALLTEAGPCGYGLTCVPTGQTYAPCSPDTAAEFELVAPLLQQCDDATRYFNRDVWVSADKPKHCTLNSPCGKLVPYILNNDVYSRLCGPYQKFVYVTYAFGGYCRGEPVASLPGDNGLLVSLKQQSPPATTVPPTPTTTALPTPTTTTPPPPTPMTPPPPTPMTPPATTTTAPATPEPTTTTADANVVNTMAPTPTANEAGSASTASGPGERETTVVGPGAAANKTPAPVPSSSKPASSSTTRLVVSMGTIVTSGFLVWLH